MNRIGGPSAFPHSRTCSCKPPPPATVWVCIRPVASVVVVISCLLVVAMPTPIVIAGRAGARRARRLIFRGRAPYLRPRDAYERLPPWWPPRDTGRVEPRARAFAGRAAELETLEQA